MTDTSYIVNVIIFLAPMSGFNQVLAEDESVNRLVRINSLSRLGQKADGFPNK